MKRCHMPYVSTALVIVATLAFDLLGKPASAAALSSPHQGPPLSSAAHVSRFAREHHLRAADLTRLHTELEVSGRTAPPADLRVRGSAVLTS